MNSKRFVALGLVAVGAGIGSGVAADALLPANPLVRGLAIDSRVLPRGVDLQAWLEADRDSIRDREIVLRGEGFQHAYKFADLGIDLDLVRVRQDAENVGHVGSFADRFKQSRQAARGEVDVPLTYLVREATAETVLEAIAPKIAKKPIDASIDLAEHKKVADIDGEVLDVDATLAAIEASDFHDGEVIDLVTKPLRAKITLEALTAVDIEKVVSSYETGFHTWGTGAGRAVNISNAARYLDGAVVMPGEVFSFNDRVGPRSLDRGFTWAPEILADELTQGVGGGTCQVSTTLFGAALFGSLDVVERRSHSRPSSYTKLGLDATVIYGSQDLKIRNTLSFPIMIHAYLPKPDAIRVELLGGNPVADVTYSFGIGSSSDFLRRITVKPFLAPGTHILHQKGARGYDVTSLVTIKYRDGRTEERTYFSGYRPTPEVFWVGPGSDETELPPLPEHARGIEGRPTEADQAYSAL